MLFAQDRGEPVDQAAFDAALIADAIADAVRKQADAGIDVVDDGEMSKISYGTYIRHRLSGFVTGDVPRQTPEDLNDFPEFHDRLTASGGDAGVPAPDLPARSSPPTSTRCTRTSGISPVRSRRHRRQARSWRAS